MVFLTLEVNVNQLETSNEQFTLISSHYQEPCNLYGIYTNTDKQRCFYIPPTHHSHILKEQFPVENQLQKLL